MLVVVYLVSIGKLCEVWGYKLIFQVPTLVVLFNNYVIKSNYKAENNWITNRKKTPNEFIVAFFFRYYSYLLGRSNESHEHTSGYVVQPRIKTRMFILAQLVTRPKNTDLLWDRASRRKQ
jgi:hypothetical protein